MSGRSQHRAGLAGVAALVIGWGLGCGSEAPPPVTNSDVKATVKGVVTVDGKPLNRGTITFDPSNIGRRMAPMATADIAIGGKYQVETLVGSNTVQVISPNMTRGGGGSFDVKEGANEFNLDVKTAR